MQYMILISGPDEEMGSDMGKEWFEYTQAMKKAGVMKHGDALAHSRTGIRISEKSGKRTILDGPFTEAKEVVGGYYLIETKTRQDALAWAEKCPGVRNGTVELREVQVFG